MRTFVTAVILSVAAAAIGLAGDAAAGKAVYEAKCKACHGADGSGKALKLKDIREDSDADLKKSISDGWGKMKPIPSAAAQADDVVAYVKSLK